MNDDAIARLEALEVLERIVDTNGPTLLRSELRNVALRRNPPHLVDRQKGIWNPNWLDATLSVLTVHNSRYPDEELGDGVWAYSFREGSAEGDNRRLKAAHDLNVDIIYFRPAEGLLFKPIFPVRVAEVYPEDRKVILVRKDIDKIDWRAGGSETVRQWAEQTVQKRLHQSRFRESVMRAYQSTCAICGLKYERLLDAAHIDSDKSEFGDAAVDNGLALCKIHHQAYDWNFLGINENAEVRVKKQIRKATDGPMLAHGLQDMHGRKLLLPRNALEHPKEERLKRRYDAFLKAKAGSR